MICFSLLLSVAAAATSPFQPSSPEHLKPLNEPFYEEPEAPVLSLGERVAWIIGGNAVPEFGVVRWIGRMPQVCRTWTVGVEFVSHLSSILFLSLPCSRSCSHHSATPDVSSYNLCVREQDNAIGSGDGRMDGRRYFTAKENFAKFLPLAVLTRVDHYAGRPRSGERSPSTSFPFQWTPVTLVTERKAYLSW